MSKLQKHHTEVIAAVVMAIASIAIAVLGGLQWGTLKETNANNRATQRAFVYVSDVRLQGITKTDGSVEWWVIPTWENSGSTPTQYLDVETYCPFGQKITNYFQLDKLACCNNPRALGPKQKVSGITCPISAEKAIKFQKGGYGAGNA